MKQNKVLTIKISGKMRDLLQELCLEQGVTQSFRVRSLIRRHTENASICPECGRPIKTSAAQPSIAGGRRCPYCKACSVGKARGLQGIGEVSLVILLFCMGILPGIIYYVYIESVPYCSSCGRRVRK